jgi:hypothetical protein
MLGRVALELDRQLPPCILTVLKAIHGIPKTSLMGSRSIRARHKSSADQSTAAASVQRGGRLSGDPVTRSPYPAL